MNRLADGLNKAGAHVLAALFLIGFLIYIILEWLFGKKY